MQSYQPFLTKIMAKVHENTSIPWVFWHNAKYFERQKFFFCFSDSDVGYYLFN